MSCLLPPVCAFCIHFNENIKTVANNEVSERECLAFLEIPEAIIRGNCDHSESYIGDQGYRFKLKPDLKEEFEEVNELRVLMNLPKFISNYESTPTNY